MHSLSPGTLGDRDVGVGDSSRTGGVCVLPPQPSVLRKVVSEGKFNPASKKPQDFWEKELADSVTAPG